MSLESKTRRLTAALADRYRLDRELGAGGMATVYRARDLKHARDVAIKVMRPEVSAVLAADRFLLEIRTTASLQPISELREPRVIRRRSASRKPGPHRNPRIHES